MADRIREATLSFSKCHRKFFLTVTVGLALFCFISTTVALVLIFVLLCPDCSSPNSMLASIYWAAAMLLLCIGVMTLALLAYYKKTQNSENYSTPQVVISSIPAADLEKSPAPVLICNHIPRRQPFVKPSSIDLPDYFIVVQDSNEVYSSMDEDVWLEGFPETPPPCYEQALELTTLAASVLTDNDVSKQIGDSQHNVGELFVKYEH